MNLIWYAYQILIFIGYLFAKAKESLVIAILLLYKFFAIASISYGKNIGVVRLNFQEWQNYAALCSVSINKY
jgi:hypothetical protein